MDDGRTWTKYTTKYQENVMVDGNDVILGVGSCMCDGVSDEMY